MAYIEMFPPLYPVYHPDARGVGRQLEIAVKRQLYATQASLPCSLSLRDLDSRENLHPRL